jgi:5'-methylthioadenosine phosphorylase
LIFQEGKGNSMRRLGVIAGSAYRDLLSSETVQTETIHTAFGEATIWLSSLAAFVLRHGVENTIPPHQINHQANMLAFKETGISQIIGISCTGSLRRTLPPRSVMIPHDYVDFWGIKTVFTREIRHITPGLDEGLRTVILDTARRKHIDVMPGGVYVQTLGPRLETKAEIAILKNFGDVVGMTMASEATLAKELDLAYASICSVDNFCHGITDTPLTEQEIVRTARQNADTVKALIHAILEERT